MWSYSPVSKSKTSHYISQWNLSSYIQFKSIIYTLQNRFDSLKFQKKIKGLRQIIWYFFKLSTIIKMDALISITKCSPLSTLSNPVMVSLRGTYFPSCPVKTSATWKGWDKNFWIFLALTTVNLSSSDNSSIPRMAMISWSDLKSCKEMEKM